MSFETSIWLAGIPVAILLLGLLYAYSRVKRIRAMEAFAESALIKQLSQSVSRWKRPLKFALVLAGACLMLFSLARPQWGYTWVEVKSRGVDILFALDASKSMLAEDIKPNRLTRAKLAIEDLLAESKSDRYGLVAFAGDAFLQCPLTLDHNAFRMSLRSTDTNVISRGGSDISAAIREALATYDDNENEKVLILITDGEDLAEEGVQAARNAADKGLRVYTVGVGSSDGVPIPITDQTTGRTVYKRDAQGDIITTKLDEKTLREIAEATGGYYTPLGSTGEGLTQAVRDGLALVPEQERESGKERQPIERYQIFLSVALGLLILEPFIGTRRRVANTSGSALAMLVVGLFFLPAPDASAQKVYQPADRPTLPAASEPAPEEEPSAESQEDSPIAAEARLTDPRELYNRGVTFYQKENYTQARQVFEDSLSGASLDLQAKAFYNLGNTLAQLGLANKEKAPKTTLEQWKQGVTHYDNAIELNPSDADAAHNREELLKQIEELERMLEQQKQQEQQNQEQQQDEQKQNEEQQEKDSDQQQQQNQDGSQQQNDQQQGESDKDENNDSSQSPQQGDSSGQNQQGQQDQQQDGQQGQQGQSPQDQQQQQGQPQDGGEPKDDPLSNARQQNRNQQGEREGKQQGARPDKPQEPSPEDNPQAAAVKPDEETGEKEGEQVTVLPGAMRRDEALQLLRSLEASEEKLPVIGFGKAEKPGEKDEHKDW